MEKDKKEIDQLVRKLQNTWLEHRVADLEAFFHEDVVIFSPGSSEKIEGRDAMIGSYKQYLATSTTHNFQITNLHSSKDSPRFSI